MRIERQQLFYQPAAGRGHQPQFVAVVMKRRVEHPRLLQQIAVEPQRRDHVAGVVGYLGQALAPAAQVGQGLDHDLHLLSWVHGVAGQVLCRQARFNQTGCRQSCLSQPCCCRPLFELRCLHCLSHIPLLLPQWTVISGQFQTARNPN